MAITRVLLAVLSFARKTLLPLAGIAIILFALIFNLAKLSLPLFDDKVRSLIEHTAQAYGLQLHVGGLSLSYGDLGPVLVIEKARMDSGEGRPPVELQSLHLELDLLHSLWQMQVQLASLEIGGLSLNLQRDGAGRWSLSHWQGGATPSADQNDAPSTWPTWLGIAGQVVLSHSQLDVSDAISGLHLSLADVDILFQQGEQAQRLALVLQLPPELGGKLEVRAHLQGTLTQLGQPSGEFWLHAAKLNLPGWRALFVRLPQGDLALPVALSDLPQLKSGELEAKVWLQLQQGVVSDVQAGLDFHDLNPQRPQLLPEGESPAQTALPALSRQVNIHLEHRGPVWHFDLDTRPLAPSSTGEMLVEQLQRLQLGARDTKTPATVQHLSMRRDGEQLSLAAEHIDLEWVRPWMIATPILPLQTRRLLQRHRPQGEVHSMALMLDLASGHTQGQAQASDLGWQGHGSLPGVSGLDAEAWLDGRSIVLRLDSQDVSIDTMGQLRERIRLQQLQGDVAVFLPDASVADAKTGNARSKIHLQAWRAHNPDLTLELDARIDIPEDESPLIQAQGRLLNVPTQRIPAYLPVRLLLPEAIDWLDTALSRSGGYVPKAEFSVDGPLTDFPDFHHNTGLLRVDVDFERLNLDYAPLPAPGWPKAENLRGQLHFINNSFGGVIHGGSVRGTVIEHGALAMLDFDHPRLALALKLAGQSERMFDTLRHSPLFSSPKDLDGLQLRGAARLHLDLDLRLDPRDARPDRIEGWFLPQQVQLDAFGIPIDKLHGELHFVDLNFSSQNLSAELKGQPMTLQVASRLDMKTPAAERGYLIKAQTHAQLADWLPASPWLTRLPGTFPIEAELRLSADPLRQPDMTLTLHSDLTDLAVNYPAPLSKDASTARPTQAELHFAQGTLDQVRIQQGERLRADLRLTPNGIQSGAVHLGTQHYGQRSEQVAGELLLSGNLDSVNVHDWLDLGSAAPADSSASTSFPPTLRLGLKLDQLHALGSDWANVAVEGRHDARGWNIELDAANLSGQLLYPDKPTNDNPVTARLSRLLFPAAAKLDRAANTTNIEPSPLDPATLPPLKLNIDELSYSDLRLRAIELRATPTHDANGSAWVIEPLRASSVHLELKGRAAWRRSPQGRASSELALDLASDDVGKALSGLGAKHALRRGRLENSRLSASWPGGLHQFAWRGAHGRGEIHLLDGEIDKVELGAGRVLGLISLTELPRRLMLDFGDVFGSGLAFERIDSEMTLNDGRLFADRFEMKSPALKLSVQGYGDLIDDSLHYQMTATPSLGNVLPIVGTVAGGPIIGGATFVAQKLFELAGGRFMTLDYRIRGTWDNPIIERGKAPSPQEATP